MSPVFLLPSTALLQFWKMSQALFEIITHMPLTHRGQFCKLTSGQGIHFIHISVIKTSSTQTALRAHWRKTSLQALWGMLLGTALLKQQSDTSEEV